MLRFTLALILLGLAPASAQSDRASPMLPSPTWDEIKPDVIGDAPILNGDAILTLDAPFRAEDAAIVPIHITQPPDSPRIAKLILVVDENPAPVVATFTFGPAMGPLDLETRVRVNAYSNVRAIAETDDGTFYMTGRHVRAAGGCSAPASKDAAAALAALGQMRTRWFDAAPAQSGIRREAQIMLRHPNYSGLQRNQVTHLFVPAEFVDTLEVRLGDQTLFTMEGGISISEDPTFRFRYTDTGAGQSLTVHAHDTDGREFNASFPLDS